MAVAQLVVLLVVAHFAGGYAAIFNVMDYGAKGDSKTDDVQAFVKAWEAACVDRGSPTVLIPKGRTFLLSKVLFSGPSHSSIRVQIDGNLVAPNKLWTNELTHWIMFSTVNNLAISGSGQIDGQGSIWWDCKNKNRCNDEVPNSFGIFSCNTVSISGIRFIDSPGKHMTVHASTGVYINGLHITAPEDSPNTDGIYIQDSQHVQLTDLTIGTGDDCITLGSGSSDVNVSLITCGPGHGISIGSLGRDNSKATVSNVRVINCNLTNTMTGARIKTWQGGSGYARDISFENINFNSVQTPIVIDQYYCNGGHNCGNTSSAVQVSHVSFVNARGTSSRDVAISLACSESVPCSDIVMDNVSIWPAAGVSKASTYCQNAHGKKVGRVTPEVPCLS